MRILLTGATGMIGSALAQALLARGHSLVCAVRSPGKLALRGPGVEAVRVDLAEAPPAAWWRPLLAEVDAVVNAVGIIREARGQSFQALHADAPSELFRAAAQAGVKCVVQVSALGADERAQSRYHRTKKAADDVLRGLPLHGAVVQPSLVFKPGGASAGMFLTLASLPALAFPQSGGMAVQPVHLDDVVDGIVRLLEAPPPRIETIAFTGPRPMAMRDYLGALRAQLGYRLRQWMLPYPTPLFMAGARVAAHVPGSILDAETAGMLLAGNAAPSDRFAALLGRAPRDAAEFLPPDVARVARRDTALGLWLPVLRIALALLWIWTGIVSLGLYPVEDSYALLARVGLHGALAGAALYGAAGLDILLGVLTLAAPARWRGAVWGAQVALVLGYTLLITLFLPEQWLHPYGPVSKNLPILAAIALLWSLEERR